MSRPFCTRFAPCAGLIALLMFVGCGGGPGYVTGKVTYKGKALTSGAVTFHGQDGRTDSGAIKADGTYVIPSAPTGTVKVTVVVRQVKAVAKPKKGPGATVSEHPGKDKAAPEPATPAVLIPRIYETPETSTLTFTVTGGKQTIDIPLS